MTAATRREQESKELQVVARLMWSSTLGVECSPCLEAEKSRLSDLIRHFIIANERFPETQEKT